MIGQPDPRSILGCRQRLLNATFNLSIARLRAAAADTQLKDALAEMNAAAEACSEWLIKLQAAADQAKAEMQDISERRSHRTPQGTP